MEPSSITAGTKQLFSDERFGENIEQLSSAEDRPRLLKDQRNQLINHRKKLAVMRTACLVSAAIVFFCAPVLLLWATPRSAATAAAYGVLFFILYLIIRQRMRELGDEIDERDHELDLLTINETSEELRAQKLFQLHSRRLQQYYDQTLHQGAYIFWVGIICILLGFGVIGVTFWLVQTAAANDLSEQIIVGALGAIGGIMANFIAVLYLRMQSSTLRSMTDFHNRLVLTHHLHFGNLLVAKIKDDALRESTLGLIAQALAVSLGKSEAEILRELTAPVTASSEQKADDSPVATAEVHVPRPTSSQRGLAGRLATALGGIGRNGEPVKTGGA